MRNMEPDDPQPSNPRVALAQAAGLSAFVYGYPLLESTRTCRLQTRGATEAGDRPPIDSPLHWRGPTTAADRDVVTPANDLMYTTAWIDLANGPRLLQVPSAARFPGRYFVLALYDAYTENFENLGPRNCSADGEKVLLVGPNAQVLQHLAAQRIVRTPTDLVWLLARILVVDADDLVQAKEMQQTITIAAVSGTKSGDQPASVECWSGAPIDPIAAVTEHGEPPEAVAARFYANLCRALADAPGRPEDQGMVAWFGNAGLKPGNAFDWALLEPELRAGLLAGFRSGVELIAAAPRRRNVRPWVLQMRNGRYGSDYLLRAVIAYIGLGALHAGEALYAAGHFDADGHPLSGEHRYTLQFAADDPPPADAFWSVTLYDADRFLYPNPIERHAIGDRTRGLKRDPDGSLTIRISHDAPTDTSNWLPAPAGRFYLILRLYHPRDEEVRGWRIPPVTRSPA